MTHIVLSVMNQHTELHFLTDSTVSKHKIFV